MLGRLEDAEHCTLHKAGDASGVRSRRPAACVHRLDEQAHLRLYPFLPLSPLSQTPVTFPREGGSGDDRLIETEGAVLQAESAHPDRRKTKAAEVPWSPRRLRTDRCMACRRSYAAFAVFTFTRTISESGVTLTSLFDRKRALYSYVPGLTTVLSTNGGLATQSTTSNCPTPAFRR